MGSFRKGLIVFQFIISIGLIVAVLVTQNQSIYIQSKDLGFKKDNIVVLNTNHKLTQHMTLFKNKLLANHDIQHVSFSNEIPGNRWGGYCCMRFNNLGKYQHDYNMIDPDFFNTYGMDIVQGRNFNWDKRNDEFNTFVINETSTHQYQITQPLGSVISNTGCGASGEIIGVVKDFHHRSLHNPIRPLVFYWSTREKDLDLYKYVSIKISDKDIASVISHVKSEWNHICPEFPFDYTFFDESFDRLYKADQQLGNIFFLFSLLAILIACLGVLGLTTYSVQKRVKEIGIRKVLGASLLNILLILTKDFTKLIILANIIAWPLAWYTMNQWLQNFTYHIELTIWPFLLSGLLALMIALFTISWQAVRAVMANPVDSLRYE